MNAPNAICMSVDYRVTNRNDGAVLDPFAIKSLIIQTSMEPGGPKAILAYTGLAELWGRMPMGRWLRETLRGECQSIGDLVGHLLNQLNKKIASFNQVLIINILAVNGPNGEERYCGGISNTQDFQTAMPQFVGGFGPIDTPRAFANGSAAFTVQAGGYPDLLKAHTATPDHSADDHMNLLARINREVAEADPDGPVSPYCFVTCVGSDTNWVPRMQIFLEPGETPPPFHMPMIVCGIDVSNPTEQIQKAFQNRAHPTLNEDQLRRNLDRRP